jgi:hypothetical protein
MQLRQVSRLPVKSGRRSLGMSATQRKDVRGGSATLPHFILSFILRLRPIVDASDFPMVLVFWFFHRLHD